MRNHYLLSLFIILACGHSQKSDKDSSEEMNHGETINTSDESAATDLMDEGNVEGSDLSSGGDTPSSDGGQSASSTTTDPVTTEETDSGNNDVNTTASTSSSSETGNAEETNGSSSSSDSSDTEGGTTEGNESTADTGSPDGTIPCGTKIWACGNGIDDDNDGLIDLDDPECTSPCDDQEKSFLTDLPGQNSDCKADCYFDQDSGQGNDHCVWNLTCDPKDPGGDIGCGYKPSAGMCEAQIPDICLDVCVPLLPNGCDCFGCCEVQTTNETRFIYLGSNSECSLDNLDACGSCTFQSQCSNECVPDDCELCFGQDELPEHCDEASCPMGTTSCTTSTDCSSGQFCQTGCCVAITPG